MTELPEARPPPDTRQHVFGPDSADIADARAAEYASWAERDRQQQARIAFLEARLAKAATAAASRTITSATSYRAAELEARIAGLRTELGYRNDELDETRKLRDQLRAELALAHSHIEHMARATRRRRWWQI